MKIVVVAVSIAIALLAPGPTLASAPASGAGDAGTARRVDLGPALEADGTFRGVRGTTGTVDMSGWRLVSDLDDGEPPRFAPLRGATRTSLGTQAVAPAWSALGSNGAGEGAITTSGAAVYAAVVSGSSLYIGGLFVNVANIPEADFLARWDGSAWNAVGSGGPGAGALNGHVAAMAMSGGTLYVGGSFTDAAGINEADFVAAWNGSFWSALGSNSASDGALNNSVTALAVAGAEVYVAGYFDDAATISLADRLARWNGSTWSAMSSSSLDSPNGTVKSLVFYGGALFAGGFFTNLGGFAAADSIARWNGTNWEALGGGLNGGVEAIAFAPSGLPYAGGSFTDAGGQAPADYIARFDGSNWTALGSNGAGNGAVNSTVFAIVVSGSDVYVGGQFSNAAGIPEADRIALFNGTSWSGLGSNGSGDGALNSVVRSLAVGSSLFIGGDFANAGGVATADYVAAWGPLATYRPDGRIRKGSGNLVGNDVYNTTGSNQTRTGSTAPGNTITFNISLQNDGDVADRLRVGATGTSATGYAIKYFRGTTDITAAVNGGTYQTASLAPGSSITIAAKVTVKATAAGGSSVSRLVSVRSVNDSSKVDVVKFVGKRS